ncbi:MAG: hypothetical protein IPP17_22665 [Bacteroidetes bacterium]|nr:hypothetical protein [Bacteroidota bacterium]
MNQTHRNYLLHSLLLLALFAAMAGCRKVDVSADVICKALPESPVWGWRYSFDTPVVGGARFNPNNPNEIVILDYTWVPHRTSICILNTATAARRCIYEGNVDAVPSWGKNGWILFVEGAGTVYRIHESGDSLQALTSSGANYDPVWNVDGLRYGFRSNGTGTNLYYLFHEDGTPIDTLINSGLGQSWNHPTYSPGAYSAQLVLTDTERDSLIILESEPDNGQSGGGAVFVDDHTLVYAYPSGIYAMDIQTRKKTVLRETCNSVLYKFPDYSPTLNKLIWLKITLTPLSYSEMRVTHELVTMDADGNHEELVGL